MPMPTITTIKCPNCGQSLPGSAPRCQFCGSTIGAGVARPADAYKYRIDERKTWQEVAYYVLAIIWVLQGGYLLAQAFGYVPNILYTLGKGSFLGIIGAVQIFIGAGLLFEAVWAQFLVKILSWLNLTFGILGYLYAFVQRTPGALVVFLAMQTWQVGLAAMQLYVINKVGDA